MHKVSILVHNCNCSHEIPAVDGMHDGSHDNKSFSLWNDVFLDQSSAFVLHFFSARFINLEVTSVDERLVSCSTLGEDKVFRVFFKLILNLIHDA